MTQEGALNHLYYNDRTYTAHDLNGCQKLGHA